MLSTTNPSRINKRLVLSLGLHSAAIIAFQLSLMQLISIVQWHHFAYMIISIAMLGFGASGTLLALAREKLLHHSNWLVPFLMIVSGMLMAIVFPLSRAGVFRFDVFLLFSGGGGLLALMLNYLLFFLPFFFGALAIGIIFIRYSQQIGSYYFSNLLGSGAGGLLALWLMASLLPLKVPAMIGLLSIVSGLILTGRSSVRYIIPAGIWGFLLAIMLFNHPGELHLSEYKALEKTLHLPDAEVVHRRPSIFGLLEVVNSPAQRYAPAVSFSFSGEIPGGKAVFVNGDFYGHILAPVENQNEHILSFTTQQLPYIAANPKKVLCINAGSGVAVSHALANGAQKVDAVIENIAVVNLLKNELKEASGGVLLEPEVEVFNMQARNFLADKSIRSNDLIVLPLLDGFGGTSGLNALREEYAYTLEAFELMLQRLNPGGMISVSTWMDYPPRTSLKIPATLAEAARLNGIEQPLNHLAAIRSWGTVTFILKKEAFKPNELNRIRAFCNEMFFDPLLLPDLQPEERQQFNIIDDQQYFERLDRIMANEPSALEDYGFAIKPSTDNKPYFSQFLRLNSIRHMAGIFGDEQMPFLELGYLTLLITLLQSTLLALLLIVLPLFSLKKSRHGKSATLLYFGALGLGYMFAEIILIQRFVLYFGQPVYAVAAVISAMMLFSGIGSLLSQKLEPSNAVIRRIAVAVAIMLLLFVFILTPLLQTTIAFSSIIKISISLGAIGLPAFVMGMLFPLGIRLLDHRDASQIPWAWGINGCLSVISTSLATLIAVESGFQTVIIIAALAYLLAAIAFSSIGKIFQKKSVS
jgi:predicted membrane-bound spermidine synthase